jgi:CubicO group peptidase (beta-lactamase class C family)
MDNTAFYVGGDILPRRATAYRLSADGETYVRVLGEPSAYTGGGIYTTVLDLLKFDQALYGEQLLNEANKSIMFTPVEASPNYAYGWVVMQFGGTTMIGHSGGSGGFNSEFRRYPETGYTAIILSNDADAAYYLANKLDLVLFDMPYALATEADKHYRRAMAVQRQESYKTALALFEKNVSGDTPHLPSLYQCARTRILGEFDQQEAIVVLDRYIVLADESTRPSIAAAWWRKGVAYEQLGQIEQAIASHEKCLELDAGWEESSEALARLRNGKQ